MILDVWTKHLRTTKKLFFIKKMYFSIFPFRACLTSFYVKSIRFFFFQFNDKTIIRIKFQSLQTQGYYNNVRAKIGLYSPKTPLKLPTPNLRHKKSTKIFTKNSSKTSPLQSPSAKQSEYRYRQNNDRYSK